MANFALSSTSSMADIAASLNYVLQNVVAANYYGNSNVAAYIPTDPTVSNIDANVNTISNTALFANTTTGVIGKGQTSTTAITFLYQYVAIAYANSADGATGFSFTDTNKGYFGIRNQSTTSISTNPTDYIWYAVSGGFGTTKHLYYISYGANAISFAVATSPPNSYYQLAPSSATVNLNITTSVWIPNAFITNQQILNNTITGAQIALSTLTGNLIQASTITGNLISSGTLTGNLLAASTITGNLIAGSTITGNLIATNTLTGNLIALSTITGNLIVPGTIYGNAILANSLQANAIVAGSITSTQLQAGLLIAGNIQSNNTTFGLSFAPGYWMNYITGDGNFGGNLYVGNNAIIQGVITSGNINANVVNSKQIVQGAVTNSKQAYYAVNLLDGGQNLYKMPKLINYTNSYNGDGWSANGRALILAATITPTDQNSTIVVQYNTTYLTDTGNVSNAWVGLYRSRNEGIYNPVYGGTFYGPYLPTSHRRVKIAAKDPNSSSAPPVSYIIAGGNYLVSSQYPSNPTNMIGDLGIWANAYVSNTYVYSYTNGTTNTWANLIYSGNGFQDFVYNGVINSAYFNGNVNIEYPVGGISAYKYYYTDTMYEPWGVYSGSSSPVNHPYLAITSSTYYDATTQSYSPGNSPGNSQILRMPSDNVAYYSVNPVIEANITCSSLNGLASNIAAYGNTKTNYTAIVVGDYANIWVSNNRNYSNSGVYSSNGAWYKESITTTFGNAYTGNLQAVAYAAPADVMDQSSYSLGGNTAANAVCSNTYIAVGENGGVLYRDATHNSWVAIVNIPPQHHRTTFRGICYDAYRYRWWAVGDYGAIMWADDRGTANLTYMVWNTYNSGTMRNLYDIKWDPVTTNWVAVGDGIVIADNGMTVYNGQRSYPGGKAFAYEIVAAGTGYPKNQDYEPVVLEAQMTNSSGIVFNGFTEYPQTVNDYTRTYFATTSNATTLANGTDISSVYVEPPGSANNPYSFGHYPGVPITFYLVAGADPTSNVIVGNPTLTITEYKR